MVSDVRLNESVVDPFKYIDEREKECIDSQNPGFHSSSEAAYRLRVKEIANYTRSILREMRQKNTNDAVLMKVAVKSCDLFKRLRMGIDESTNHSELLSSIKKEISDAKALSLKPPTTVTASSTSVSHAKSLELFSQVMAREKFYQNMANAKIAATVVKGVETALAFSFKVAGKGVSLACNASDRTKEVCDAVSEGTDWGLAKAKEGVVALCNMNGTTQLVCNKAVDTTANLAKSHERYRSVTFPAMVSHLSIPKELATDYVDNSTNVCVALVTSLPITRLTKGVYSTKLMQTSKPIRIAPVTVTEPYLLKETTTRQVFRFAEDSSLTVTHIKRSDGALHVCVDMLQSAEINEKIKTSGIFFQASQALRSLAAEHRTREIYLQFIPANGKLLQIIERRFPQVDAGPVPGYSSIHQKWPIYKVDIKD